jgi:hypothetical protein
MPLTALGGSGAIGATNEPRGCQKSGVGQLLKDSRRAERVRSPFDNSHPTRSVSFMGFLWPCDRKDSMGGRERAASHSWATDHMTPVFSLLAE